MVVPNWRGVMAPPGISDEDREAIITMIEEMHDSPEWQEALETNGWTDFLQTGDEYETFLEEENQRVKKSSARWGSPVERSPERSEPEGEARTAPQPGFLGPRIFAVAILAFGLFVLFGTFQISGGRASARPDRGSFPWSWPWDCWSSGRCS